MTSTSGIAPAAVIIPVRSFSSGKSRLGDRLDAAGRAALLRRMAEQVVSAAGPLPTVVISSAAEVLSWAHHLGLQILEDPGSLDLAAAAGQAWAGRRRIPRVIVVHADLPLARGLAPFAADGRRPIVAAVPCHRDDGTPVLSLPADQHFNFAYGPGSFRRHAAEARRLGLAWRVRRDPYLARDVDTPEDLLGLGLPVTAPALV